jgi:hypothetical protein
MSFRIWGVKMVGDGQREGGTLYCRETDNLETKSAPDDVGSWAMRRCAADLWRTEKAGQEKTHEEGDKARTLNHDIDRVCVGGGVSEAMGGKAERKAHRYPPCPKTMACRRRLFARHRTETWKRAYG